MADANLLFDIFCAVVLLFTALIGAYVPRYLGGDGNDSPATSLLFHLGNMLSGGVMLSAGFCHLLADALRHLTFIGRFPIATFLAAVGYIVTLVADQIVTMITESGGSSSSSPMGSYQHLPLAEQDGQHEYAKQWQQYPAGKHTGGMQQVELLGMRSGAPSPSSSHANLPAAEVLPISTHSRQDRGGGSLSPRRTSGARAAAAAAAGGGGLSGYSHSSEGLPVSCNSGEGGGTAITVKAVAAAAMATAGRGEPRGHQAASSGFGACGTNGLGSSAHASPASSPRSQVHLHQQHHSHLVHRHPPSNEGECGCFTHADGRQQRSSSSGGDGLHLAQCPLRGGSGGGHAYDAPGHGHSHGGAAHNHFEVLLSQKHLSFATAILLAGALCIHSILEGIALGAQANLRDKQHIMLAIVAHKGLAAYALGASIMESKPTASRYWTVISLFSLATPVGIGIGFLFDRLGPGKLAASMSALASGTFLYVAMMEVIPKELESSDHRGLKMVALLAGFGAMSLLAVWA